jgi:hypothetical protein
MPALHRLAATVLTAGLAAATLAAPTAPANAETDVARKAGGVTVPGSFTGYAFDTCEAPAQEVMDAWRLSSPYAGVGIYIGGVNRLCPQAELDADWVRTQHRRGWHVLPIQVGPQSSCTDKEYADELSTDRAVTEKQGRAEASSAVATAKSLAIGKGSTLYYDMEDFDVSDDLCRRAVLGFLSGWTKQLHALGYDSGVYSNIAAAIYALDNAHNISRGSYAMPDDIWFAWDNGRADTATTTQWVKTTEWDDHARIHQYRLDVTKSYAGVPMTIDQNWVDVGRGSFGTPGKAMCPGVDVDLRRYPTLKKGARGDAVEAAQCLLRRQHLGRAKVTGRYDPATVKAVQKAQRKLDLKPTGKLTRRTWVALLARGSHPLLKVGSTGEPVRRLQRALVAALGTRLTVDGVVDKRTAKAVTKLQKREGLERTGNVDDPTWERLAAGG